MDSVSRQDIENAAETLNGVTRKTPLEYSDRLSAIAGVPVYLKREDLQVCRSFKSRGAYNRIAQLSEAERAVGVVCASAGNHAQGVANACRVLGIHGTIFLPQSTPRQKRERILAIGGDNVTLEYVDGPFDEAQKVAQEYCTVHGQIYIHPYDDPQVIAGQGTVAKEILEQLPEVTDVIVPVGGGGLVAGVATYLKAAKPSVRVIGVEAEGAPSAMVALDAGEPTTLENLDPFVDGTAVLRVGDNTYQIVAELVDQVRTVPEGAVSTEMLDLYNSEGIISEPAGALASALLTARRTDADHKLSLHGPTVLIISGGNNDLSRYAEVMERSMTYRGLRHYFLVTFPQQPGALRVFLDKILGPHDDIVHFEYTKKNNRDTGPALVGVDIHHPDDLAPLLARMADSHLHIEPVERDSELLRFLV